MRNNAIDRVMSRYPNTARNDPRRQDGRNGIRAMGMGAWAWVCQRICRDDLLVGIGRDIAMTTDKSIGLRYGATAAVFVMGLLAAAALPIAGPIGAAIFVLPIIVVVILILPAIDQLPDRWLYFVLASWIVLGAIWPRYVAVRLAGLPDLVPSRLAFLLLLVGIAFSLVKSTSFRSALSRFTSNSTILIVLLSAYIAFRFLSIFVSDFAFYSTYGFGNELVLTIPPLFLAGLLLRTRDRIGRIATIFAFTAVIVACIGLLEFVLKRNLLAVYLPPGFGLSDDFVEQAISEKIRGGGYRAQATFAHPLLFAQYLVIALPFLVHWSVSAQRRWTRLFGWACVLVACGGVYASGSRAAMLTVVGQAVLWIVGTAIRSTKTDKESPLPWVALTLLPVVLFAAAFALYEASDVILGRSIQEIQSTSARVEMWARGLRLAFHAPFLGYGIYRAPDVLGFVGKSGFLTIDSYYLSVLIESGFISLALFVAMIVYASACGARAALSDRSDTGSIGLSVLVSLAGFAAMMMILSMPHNIPLLFFLFGLAIAVRNSDQLREGNSTQ